MFWCKAARKDYHSTLALTHRTTCSSVYFCPLSPQISGIELIQLLFLEQGRGPGSEGTLNENKMCLCHCKEKGITQKHELAIPRENATGRASLPTQRVMREMNVSKTHTEGTPISPLSLGKIKPLRRLGDGPAATHLRPHQGEADLQIGSEVTSK